MERRLNEHEKENRIVKEYERFGARVSEIFGPHNPYRLEGLEDEVEDITYETGGGKTFSFKSLLPADWKLIRSTLLEPDEPMLSTHKEKVVVYSESCWVPKAYRVPSGQELPKEARNEELIRLVNVKARGVLELKPLPAVSRVGFFLSLLHEIGHAQVVEDMEPEDKIVFKERQARIDTKKKNERSNEDKQALLKDERNAWAWALRTFHKLRRDGIDLEPKLDSNEKIFQGVSAALETRKDLNVEEMVKSIRTALYAEE